jgi:hypothetical protein
VQTRRLSLAVALLGMGLGCENTTEPYDPGDASYSVAYTPAKVVNSTVNCDRYLSYGILSLGTRGSRFEFSLNLMDDCTRAGGVWTYWEVFFEGSYAVTDTLIRFTPDSARTPPFSGSFDRSYIRLTLPARADSLAPTPIAMELGPKMPF